MSLFACGIYGKIGFLFSLLDKGEYGINRALFQMVISHESKISLLRGEKIHHENTTAIW